MGGLLHGKPVICGGGDVSNQGETVYDQCYSYDKTRLWKPFAQLDGPRFVGISNSLDGKLWIMGGASLNNPLRESVSVFENGTTQEGMKMPMDLFPNESCSTQLENGTILVIPKRSNNTYIVNPLTNEISSGPRLPRDTRKCEAISFRSPAHGGRHVIALLSYGKDSEGHSGFLDVLDYTLDATTWETLQKGNREDIGNIIVMLIKPIDSSTSELLSSPSGDGFIAIKGTADGKLKRIFQFKCTLTGCEWTEKTQRLKECHILPVVMLIPNALTNCRQKTPEEKQVDTMIKELLDKRIEISNERVMLWRKKESTTAIEKRKDALNDAMKENTIKLQEVGEYHCDAYTYEYKYWN